FPRGPRGMAESPIVANRSGGGASPGGSFDRRIFLAPNRVKEASRGWVEDCFHCCCSSPATWFWRRWTRSSRRDRRSPASSRRRSCLRGDRRPLASREPRRPPPAAGGRPVLHVPPAP